MNTLRKLTERRADLLDKIETLDAAAEAGGLDETAQAARDALVESAKELHRRMLECETRTRREAETFNIGKPEKSAETYSLLRAIRTASNGRLDGFEAEVAQELEGKAGRAASGFYAPLSALATREMSVGGGTAQQFGGNLVATETSDEIIDALRANMAVGQLGARILTNLTGNLSVPRLASAATVSWKPEVGNLDENTPEIGEMRLEPKRIGAFTVISKQLSVQTSGGAERLVRNDLLQSIATEIDRVAINGTGTNDQPRGILHTAGVGAVAIGANGGLPTWAKIVELLGSITGANVDESALGWVTSPLVRSKLLSIAKIGSTDSQTIWDALMQLPGRAAITTNVPDNLTKGSTGADLSALIVGDFSQVVLGSFGDAMDILVDPYTEARAGKTRIIANIFADVGIRRPDAFSALADIDATP